MMLHSVKKKPWILSDFPSPQGDESDIRHFVKTEIVE